MFCKADEPPPYGGGPFLFFLPLPYVSQVNPEGQECDEGRSAWVGAESSSASGVFATVGSSPAHQVEQTGIIASHKDLPWSLQWYVWSESCHIS